MVINASAFDYARRGDACDSLSCHGRRHDPMRIGTGQAVGNRCTRIARPLPAGASLRAGQSGGVEIVADDRDGDGANLNLARLPRSIRTHVSHGACRPGRSVVLAADPTTSHLQAAVGRWRARDADMRGGCTTDDPRGLIVHVSPLIRVHGPELADPAEVTLTRICAATALGIAAWLASGIAIALIAGRV